VVSAHPILVVEDEFLIALDIVAALENAGVAVVGPASTVGEALAAIEREPLRGALLDAHLGGESAGRIADMLVARGLPFAFVSGYGAESLPPAHRAAPLVRKPFTDRDLLSAIAGF
jgi:CheY-like chemotaxis protein